MQNAIEDAGIATVSLTMVPYVTIPTGVPRALHVRFPYGDPFGGPGAADTQREILSIALRWLYDAPGPNQLYKIRIDWRRLRGSRPGASR